MITTIKFADGTELSAVKITGGGRYVQGANRDVLTFQLAQDAATFDRLAATFAPENCDTITLSANGKENLQEHYTLRLNLSLQDVEITPATSEAEAVTEPRWVVEMAQKTFTERQLEKLNAESKETAEKMNMYEECIAEMASIVYA